MRDKEIRLADMPSRVICERQADGSVSCRIFESREVVDLQTEEQTRKPKSFFPERESPDDMSGLE